MVDLPSCLRSSHSAALLSAGFQWGPHDRGEEGSRSVHRGQPDWRYRMDRIRRVEVGRLDWNTCILLK